MEHVKDIEKISDLGIDGAADMAINCEWVSATSYQSQHALSLDVVGRI